MKTGISLSLPCFVAVNLLLVLPGIVYPQGKEAEEPFEVAIKGVALDRNVMDLWIETADGFESFPVSKSRISPPYTVSTTGEIVLFIQAGVDDAGEPVYRPVGRTIVTPDHEEYLLLMVERNRAEGSGDGGAREYSLLSVGRGEDFDAGTVEFLNFSSYAVACRLNNRDFTLARGETERFSQADNEDVTVGLRVAKQTDEGWKIGFNSVWSHRSDLRTLILITDHPRREGAITAKRLYDEAMPETAPPSVD